MGEHRNFFIAMALCGFVLIGWQVFVLGPAQERERARQAAEEAMLVTQEGETPAPGTAVADGDLPLPAPRSGSALPGVPAVNAPAVRPDRELILSQTAGERIAIDSPGLDGSLSLIGARIDDLNLKRYRETVEPDSGEITLLHPVGSANPYYAEFGWVAEQGTTVPLPGPDTPWRQANSGMLTPDNPVQLFWDNGAGLRFTLSYAIDENYMFTVRQGVENRSGAPVVLYPYGRVTRTGLPEGQSFWILFEGLLGVIDGVLEKISYNNLLDDRQVAYTSTGGWIGITDKYWLTALAPDQEETFDARYLAAGREGAERFQADYLLAPRVIEPGTPVEITGHFFAGAKKVDLVSAYQRDLGIERFDLTIDWGSLFFLTRPFFSALQFLNNILPGGFGWAILAFTVLVKLAFFPLANKSYEAMSKMKKLHPELIKLRERYADDKPRQQQELMELYKREKVNPLAGCLPILVQIPVFFALYKVLFVSIEMRHEPFIGWIEDLSAPDPTNIFNLFGLLPYDPSAIPVIGGLLIVGVWPIIMGLTMWVQMQLNPPPPDPVQAKIFAFMPLVFTFLLAGFASGLVIYWAWNNFLSLLQQYVIMKRMDVEIELEKKLLRFKDRLFGGGAAVTASGTGASGDGGNQVTPAAQALKSEEPRGEDEPPRKDA